MTRSVGRAEADTVDGDREGSSDVSPTDAPSYHVPAKRSNGIAPAPARPPSSGDGPGRGASVSGRAQVAGPAVRRRSRPARKIGLHRHLDLCLLRRPTSGRVAGSDLPDVGLADTVFPSKEVSRVPRVPNVQHALSWNLTPPPVCIPVPVTVLRSGQGTEVPNLVVLRIPVNVVNHFRDDSSECLDHQPGNRPLPDAGNANPEQRSVLRLDVFPGPQQAILIVHVTRRRDMHPWTRRNFHAVSHHAPPRRSKPGPTGSSAPWQGEAHRGGPGYPMSVVCFVGVSGYTSYPCQGTPVVYQTRPPIASTSARPRQPFPLASAVPCQHSLSRSRNSLSWSPGKVGMSGYSSKSAPM